MAITISDAQEILALNLEQPAHKMPPDVKAAVLLALDALTYITMLRAGKARPTQPLLPHEAISALPGNNHDHDRPPRDAPEP